MATFPIELQLKGRSALVVGLGPVGRRKAAALVKAGARVIGVDPACGSGSLAVEPIPGVVLIAEPYRPDHLRGMSLAIAAGPLEVNRRVVDDARAAGVWVCSASEPETGDFSMPAVWRSAPIVLTVSTSGASPALAAVLRDRAAKALGPAAAGLATFLAELRPIIQKRVPDRKVRHQILQAMADPRWLDVWSEQGPEGVRHEFQTLLDRFTIPSAEP